MTDSLLDPDTSIRAWMAKPNTNCGSGGYLPVNSFIVDSTDNNYRTRHYHVEGPEYDNLYSCGDKIEGWHDTVLTCYEYYFNQPITVDSDFFIGVFSNKCVLDDGTWGIHYHERKLCQAVLGGYLWFETGIVDSLHNPGGEPVWSWYSNGSICGYYPVMMAITQSPLEDTIPPCGSVDSLRTIMDGLGQVFLSWDGLSCATSYEVNYGSDKTSMDTTVITSSTTLQLTGLTPGSQAYARVRPICHHVCSHHDTTDYGPWTDTLFFTVPSDTTPCPEVHGLAASWMDTDCAYITWTPVDDLSTYQLNYAEADSLFENGTFVDCPHPYAPVCGLSTNKAYKMRVRTPCSTGMASEGYGPWSDTLLFNPQPTGIGTTDIAAFSLRPNPTRDRLTVERPDAGPATLEVFNAKGQKVMTMASDQATVTLDVSSLSAGSYLLRVTTAEGSSVRSFVVGR